MDLLKRLNQAGVDVRKHVLANERSNKLYELIKSKCMLKPAPPGCHRRNLAKNRSKMFKNHFLTILSGVDDYFPMQLWGKLLPQAELTLNLLRQSNATPSVSAHAHLFQIFDCNRMPLAPMGCGVKIHTDAGKRGSWSPHTVDGWHLGTSPDHYMSHITHAKRTKATIVSETVFLKHKHLTNPTVTHAEKVVDAARALCKAFSKRKQGMSNGTMDALRNFSNIFRTTAKSNKDKSWEEPTKQAQEQPMAVPQALTPLSRLAADLRRPERGAQARETADAE